MEFLKGKNLNPQIPPCTQSREKSQNVSNEDETDDEKEVPMQSKKKKKQLTVAETSQSRLVTKVTKIK